MSMLNLENPTSKLDKEKEQGNPNSCIIPIKHIAIAKGKKASLNSPRVFTLTVI
jgi:hypothetical protein